MFGWFKKNKNTPPPQEEKKENKGVDIWEAAVALQKKYWTPNTAEREQLMALFETKSLTFAQLYRLHHLICMEIMLESAYGEDLDFIEYEGKYKDLVSRTAETLLGDGSPYRIFTASFWLNGQRGQDPTARGRFLNMSLTHLGAIELITVDEAHNPIGIVFVPFDQIQTAEMNGTSLLIGCKLTYEGSRKQEVFWMPLLYGQSHGSPIASDVEGGSTRFIGHLAVPHFGVFGIGLGQQDLGIYGANSNQFSLVGWRNIKALVTSLDLSDPFFDEKCKGRGLNPDDFRKR